MSVVGRNFFPLRSPFSHQTQGFHFAIFIPSAHFFSSLFLTTIQHFPHFLKRTQSEGEKNIKSPPSIASSASTTLRFADDCICKSDPRSARRLIRRRKFFLCRIFYIQRNILNSSFSCYSSTKRCPCV